MRKKIIIPADEADSAIEDYEVVLMADGTNFFFPIYSLEAIRAGNCCGYAKRVARDYFGKRYLSPCDAWDMRYHHPTIPARNLRKQFDDGTLEPGDLVGIFNPLSIHNHGTRDKNGRKIPYSHIATCIGLDSADHLRLGHQVVDERGTIIARDMKLRGFIPIEIIKEEILKKHGDFMKTHR